MFYELLPLMILLWIFAILCFYTFRKRKSVIDTILFSLWLLGIITFLILFLTFYNDSSKITDTRIKLFAPIGILISSFIASASVMKSVYHSRELKQDEYTIMIHRNRKYLLTIIKRLKKDLQDIRENVERTYSLSKSTIDGFTDYFDTVNKIFYDIKLIGDFNEKFVDNAISLSSTLAGFSNFLTASTIIKDIDSKGPLEKHILKYIEKSLLTVNILEKELNQKFSIIL